MYLQCSNPSQHRPNMRIRSEPFTKTAGRETQVENVVEMCGKHVFKASRLVAKDVQGDGLFWSSITVEI